MIKLRKYMRVIAIVLIVIIGFNSLNINIATVQSNNKFTTLATEQNNITANAGGALYNSMNMVSNMISNDHFQSIESPVLVMDNIAEIDASEKPGKINISYTVSDPTTGKELTISTPWKLYQVFELSDTNDEYILLDKFKNVDSDNSFADLELTTENIILYAKNVVNFIDDEGISADKSGTTSSLGESSVDALPIGLYLLQFEDYEILLEDGLLINEDDDDNIIGYNYFSDPILVSIPGFVYGKPPVSVEEAEIALMSADYVEGYWSYTQEVSPKITYNAIFEEPSEEISVKVSKTWDSNGFANVVHPNVTVGLYKDGVLYTSASNNPVELTSTKTSHTWNSLPVDDSIVWTVEEIDPPDDYDVSVSNIDNEFEYSITNTYNPELMNISVEKIWVGDTVADRPSNVEVALYDGDTLYTKDVYGNSVVDNPVLLTPDDWSYTWNDLITTGNWNVRELSNPDDYVLTHIDNPTEVSTGNYEVEITNTYKEPDADYVKVKKVWNSNGFVDVTHPNTVTVGLFNADTGVQEGSNVVISSFSEHTWGPLKPAGTNWEVREIDPPDNYDVNVSNILKVADNEFEVTIENVYVPELMVLNVEKNWVGDTVADRPSDVEVALYKGDILYTTDVYGNSVTTDNPKRLSSSNNWKHSWVNLEIRDDWNVKETEVPGYSSTITSPTETTTNNYDVDITNTLENVDYPVMVINIEKEWVDEDAPNGIRPEYIEVELLQDGTFFVDENVENPAELNETNDWIYQWEDLEIRDDWSVREVTEIENYYPLPVTAIDENPSASSDLNLNLTNIYVAPDTAVVSVAKEWIDNDNAEEKRPDNIRVGLYENGELYTDSGIEAIVELSSENNWKYSWTELNKDSQWNVHELDQLSDYTSSKYSVDLGSENVYFFQIENTIVKEPDPDLVDISITKIWIDNNNEDEQRPDEITVGLYSDNGTTLHEEIVLNINNNWYWSKTDLEDLDWSIKEIGIPSGYYSTIEDIDSSNNFAFQIKNTYTKEEERVFVQVKKIWEDKEDDAGVRPNNITVGLYSDNGTTLRETRVLTSSNNWSYMWFDLPDLDWIVKEVSSNDQYSANIKYSKSTNGYYFEITNTYIEPDKISLDVQKIWNDNNDSENLRPTEIHVGLYDGNDKLYGSLVKLHKGNSWKYSWANLDPDINWYVKETDVPFNYMSYVREVSSGDNLEFEIINTYLTPEIDKTEIEVRKIWIDNHNELEKRPDDVLIGLYSNNATVLHEEIILGEENGWYYKWEDLDILDWVVMEIDTADGYRVNYSEEGYYFEVKNTYIISLPDMPIIPDDPENPNTPRNPGNPDIPDIPDDPNTPDDPNRPNIPETPNTPDNPSEVDIEVRKVWVNDRSNLLLNIRPAFIEAVLYRDGAIFDKVFLSNENDWYYKWEDLDPSYNWEIKENDIPKGYSVKYVKDGFSFTIHNDYMTDVPSKIPQTGVEWTLSLLSGLGLILLSVGLMLDNKLRREEMLASSVAMQNNHNATTKLNIKKVRKVTKYKISKENENSNLAVDTDLNLSSSPDEHLILEDESPKNIDREPIFLPRDRNVLEENFNNISDSIDDNENISFVDNIETFNYNENDYNEDYSKDCDNDYHEDYSENYDEDCSEDYSEKDDYNVSEISKNKIFIDSDTLNSDKLRDSTNANANVVNSNRPRTNSKSISNINNQNNKRRSNQVSTPTFFDLLTNNKRVSFKSKNKK